MLQLFKENHIPETFEKSGSSTIPVIHKGIIEALNVTVDVKHANSGDLTLKLVAPSGKTIVLQKQEGKNPNVKKSFKGDAVKKLLGEKADGVWELKVKNESGKEGTIRSWRMDMGCSKNGKSEIFIPDNNAKGLNSIQLVRHRGIIKGIKVKVDIKHPYKGDLTVKLISPAKKEVVLHDKEGGSTNNLKATYTSKDTLAGLVGQQTAGKWTLQIKDATAKDSGRLVGWKMEITYFEVDDLKKIEGIGPKIEGLLNGAGVKTFRRLAISSPAFLKQVLLTDGDRYRMHDPQTWPKQAGLAYAGKWKKLETLQDKLKGGRV